MISEHPVAQALRSVPPDSNRLTLSQLGEEHLGQKVTVIGMLTGIRRVLTKKNDTMLIAQLEDLEGTIDLVAFPRVYEKYSTFWEEDRIVAVKAKMDSRNGTSQLICDEVADYGEVEAAAPIEIAVAAWAGPDYGDEDAPPISDYSWAALDSSPAIHDLRPLMSDEVAVARMAAPPPAASREMLSEEPAVYRNGHAAGGNGHTLTEVETLPEVPSTLGDAGSSAPPEQNPDSAAEAPNSAAAPVTVVKSRQRITIARKDEPAAAEAAPAAGPQYTLHLHLPRTDDYNADLRCMQQVAKQLQQHRGAHRVILYLPKDEFDDRARSRRTSSTPRRH